MALRLRAALAAATLAAAALCACDAVNVPVLHFPLAERSGTYIDLQIGTPPQTVSVILDTGSATLAVGQDTTSGTHSICPASQVADEGRPCVIGSYTPSASSTASDSVSNCKNDDTTGHCGFTVRYGTGAYGISGYLVNDVLRLGSLSATISLGSITRMFDGWQQVPANGIFGIGLRAGNCDPTCETTAMTSLLQDAASDAFALCLGSAGTPGVLSLGGADPSLYEGDMHYVPFNGGGGGYYAVDFTAVGINGRELCSGPGCVTSPRSSSSTIVDSGTPSLFLYSGAYDALAQSSESCSADSDCFVTLKIGDTCVNAAGLMTCASGTCQLTSQEQGLVSRNDGSVNGGSSIIGNAAINQLYIEFDRSNEQIGFAQRSSNPCSVPCSAFLSATGCERGQCSWSNGQCSGGQGVGNTARGSSVASGSCMAPAAPAGGSDDGYDSESNPSPSPPTSGSTSDAYSDDDASAPTSDAYSDDDASAPTSDAYSDDDASAPTSDAYSDDDAASSETTPAGGGYGSDDAAGDDDASLAVVEPEVPDSFMADNDNPISGDQDNDNPRDDASHGKSGSLLHQVGQDASRAWHDGTAWVHRHLSFEANEATDRSTTTMATTPSIDQPVQSHSWLGNEVHSITSRRRRRRRQGGHNAESVHDAAGTATKSRASPDATTSGTTVWILAAAAVVGVVALFTVHESRARARRAMASNPAEAIEVEDDGTEPLLP